MRFDLDDEQNLLRDQFARVFAKRGSGSDPWASLVELGVPLMRVPAERGGGGASLLDAALLLEEAGKAALAAPLADTLCVTQILAQLDLPLARDWLLRIAEGTRLVALASQSADLIPYGALADAILVCRADQLYLIERPKPATRPNLAALPLSSESWTSPLDGQIWNSLASGAKAQALYAAALEEHRILIAAMQVGIASNAVAQAAAYARERTQFGRPIGSFQAIAHPLADGASEIDGARLLVWRAIWAVACGQADAGGSFAMACYWAHAACGRAVTHALRCFGGYGLDRESDIQRYFRLGKALIALAGGTDALLRRAADRLFSDEARPCLPKTPPIPLDFGFGPGAEYFANEVREFFARNLDEATAHKAHHSTDGHVPAFHRALCAAGLAYPDWPRALGGLERSPADVAALARVFEVEHGWTRVPIGLTNMGGRAVMAFGSDALKEEILPAMARGEALSCLGFSEPQSGSDVYAARFRAARADDGWVLNGQKIFTTGAHISTHILLLTRTNDSGRKHEGLTVFFVPLNIPGITIKPIYTLQDERTNFVFFDNVRIHDRYRLGEVDRGLAVMTASMALEHGGDGYHIFKLSLQKDALSWARSPLPDGSLPIERPEVKTCLAKVLTHTEIADLLCKRAIWAASRGQSTRVFGPMSKLFATETYMRDAAALFDVAAPLSVLSDCDGPLASIELRHRQSIGPTIYGGTSEIHRSLIAEEGLGLPRMRS